MTDGTDALAHLKKMGITELGEWDLENGVEPAKGTFADHIKSVEYIFWKERFKRYDLWKREWYDLYTQNGYIDTLTGFRLPGYYRRNEVLNYPVQGSAFHCLLFSLIHVVSEIKKRKMRSYVCGQIHDSVVGIVHKDELQDYIELVHHTITKRLKRKWDWLLIPLEAEVEVAPLESAWHLKKEWVKDDKGVWGLKKKDGGA